MKRFFILILAISFILSTGLVLAGNTYGSGTNADYFLGKLKARSPILESELRKLPELNDGEVNTKDLEALEDIVDLYANSEDPSIEGAFQEMLAVGKPEHRAYSTPLRVLFWIAEKKEFTEKKNPLKGYNLEKILREGQFAKAYKRLKDADQVLDMLSSPEIIAFYLPKNFRYDRAFFNRYIRDSVYKGHNPYGGAPFRSPQELVKIKRGVCYDSTNVVVTGLDRGGYPNASLLIHYRTPQNGSPGHVVAGVQGQGQTLCPRRH
jgi:hypothetical protein